MNYYEKTNSNKEKKVENRELFRNIILVIIIIFLLILFFILGVLFHRNIIKLPRKKKLMN